MNWIYELDKNASWLLWINISREWFYISGFLLRCSLIDPADSWQSYFSMTKLVYLSIVSVYLGRIDD